MESHGAVRLWGLAARLRRANDERARTRTRKPLDHRAFSFLIFLARRAAAFDRLRPGPKRACPEQVRESERVEGVKRGNLYVEQG